MVCDNSHNTADISTMKNIVLEYSDIFEGEGNFQGALKLEMNGVSKVVKKLDCSSKVTCQNPFFTSHLENTFALLSSGSRSSMIGSG
jgi:hypothetical protein